MSGFGVPVRVEGMTDISQGLINIQRSLSDLFQKIGDLSLNTTGVLGTTTNDNAPAGYVGEFVSANILVGAAVPLTSGATSNVTSVLLSAGDWDVGGTVAFAAQPATTMSTLQGAISQVSGVFPTAPGAGGIVSFSLPFITGSGNGFPVGVTRISLAAPASIFLVAACVFAAGTLSAYGFIGARRRR